VVGQGENGTREGEDWTRKREEVEGGTKRRLEVWTCGANDDGELGLGDYGVQTKRNIPQKVEVEGAWRVRVGGAHTLLEMTDGKLFAWGWNEHTACGFIGTRAKIPQRLDLLPFLEALEKVPGLPPPSPSSLPRVVDFVCSWYHSMVLLDDGSLLVWGDNDFGQLGLKEVKRKTGPRRLVIRKKAQGRREGDRGGEGKEEDGNEGGQEEGEEGGEKRREEPVKIAAIGCGNLWVWALSESGDLFTWGTGCNLDMIEDTEIPSLVENFKWAVPCSKKREWASVFFWLFLGKLDPGSKFYWPVEIIYNFVRIRW
jgi:alpha-tubulin suppressor-like RCC1 family protein